MSVEVQIVAGPCPESSGWKIRDAGAIISFSGLVRPTEAGHAIQGLERLRSVSPHGGATN